MLRLSMDRERRGADIETLFVTSCSSDRATCHYYGAPIRGIHTGIPAAPTITFDRANVFTGRAGALLRGTFGSAGALWQLYLKGNVWWGSNGFDTVSFNDVPIQTGRNGGTTLEGGGGITGKLTSNISVYGDGSYLSGISGEQRITLKGNVGLRVTW